MVIELTKASKEEILNHIAKQAGRRALKVAICVAIALFVFFFVINKPTSFWGTPFLVFRIAAIVVISFLSAVFTYVITGNRQADKYGLRDPTNTHLIDYHGKTFSYTSSFENNQPSVNPASGLSMHGGVDSAGNSYGYRRE